MSSFLAVAASSGGGIYAVATAVGGVAVSIFTVYKNAQKQAQYTGQNTGQIEALATQIGELNRQLSDLKVENAELRIKISLLEPRSQDPPSHPRKKKK